MKPLIPKQCANIHCKTGYVIYPSDNQHWYEPANPKESPETLFPLNFWYCSQECFDKTRNHNKGLKLLAQKQKWHDVAEQRRILGL